MFCINTVRTKCVSGTEPGIKVTGCCFTHDFAVNICGFAFFLVEDEKPLCRHCPILPSVVLRVPMPTPNPGFSTNTSSSLPVRVPAQALSGFTLGLCLNFVCFASRLFSYWLQTVTCRRCFKEERSYSCAPEPA